MWRVAHRAPDTALACQRLVAAGANVFEIDVRWSPHGLVVSHYASVPGTTGRLEHDNWRLRRVRAGRRDPLLTARIEVIPASADILLDLKDHAPPGRGRLLDALAELPRERTIVCSPYHDDLALARTHGFRTWLSIGDRRALDVALAGTGDQALTVRHSLLDERLVRRAHESGRRVVAWTVNDLGTARRLREHGVDGITTDRVAILNELARV